MDINDCAAWAKGDPFGLSYHDKRWCQPVHDDTELFALLCLEGQQAGLSWLTILKKEAAIREAFCNFDIDKVAAFTEAKVEELMKNPLILRNRLKIKAAVTNAKAIKKLLASSEYQSFDSYIWHFTDYRRIVHHPRTLAEIPAKDELSEKISRDLKKRGFKFTGPVIIYSYLQAIGIYDDHLECCPCKKQ